MIKPEDIAHLPIFGCLEKSDLERIASKAADLRLSVDEWLIREGEQAYFFVLIDGGLELLKNIAGRTSKLTDYKIGEFFGEVPILLGAPAFVSIRATSPARVARFEPQQLFELIQSSEKCSAIIMQTMSSRVRSVQNFATSAVMSRVLIVGTSYDTDCRDIRRFLSSNRIPYEWIDSDKEPHRVPKCITEHGMDSGASVVVDHQYCVENPTVRSVAEALGIRTSPRVDEYDVVVVGAGPAGLAAGVYGASEGLRVLIVERSTAGGQAGTSSRIENYLGFPTGISGEELSDRAMQQAARFGAETALTREVVNIERLNEGWCVELDGGQRVRSKVIVLATGVEWRILEADGINDFQGRGVLYGASRTEASSVVGKKVFIVGGGNSAGQAAMFFSAYAAEVRVLVRGPGLELTMSQYLIEQIASRDNITIEPYTVVTAVTGDACMEHVTTRTAAPESEPTTQTRDADALFIMIGAKACTAWMPEALERDENGYIKTGRDVTQWNLQRRPYSLETNLPGIFCAGDVRANSIKRVSSGVGEGSMAIAFVHQYLALGENNA